MDPRLENLRELHRVAGELIAQAEKDPTTLSARPTDLAPFVLPLAELHEKKGKASSTIATIFKALARMEKEK